MFVGHRYPCHRYPCHCFLPTRLHIAKECITSTPTCVYEYHHRCRKWYFMMLGAGGMVQLPVMLLLILLAGLAPAAYLGTRV